MQIHVYSNMYNEELLVPYWLRHYETIADKIFVWEDDSTDQTRELLSRSPKVEFLPMEQHGNSDDYYTQVLFPQYEEHSAEADWVIVADADEFVYHPNLLEVLQAEKNKGTQVILCTGYSMIAESFPLDVGRQLYEEIKLGLPDKLESKWTIHTAEKGIRFARGRHGPIYNHTHFVRNRYTKIKLLHYRYFGDEYYSNRDRVTRERNDMFYHHGIPYSVNDKSTMPDGTRAAALKWYAKHKGEAINVV